MTLSVRVLEVDEPSAKAAILDLNRGQCATRELEEAWIVQGLVRDDGLTQVQTAHLLGRHKSWVCRRLALLEKLSVGVKEDLRLGLVGPSLARELTRLPTGNQEALLALTRRETLHAQRDGLAAPSKRLRSRNSILDPFEPILKELLAKYPNLTTQRALQELQARGFPGKYTVVRQRMVLLRPRAPVPRFETEPGAQAQMDYGVYDVDFTREGRRRVYLFSYLLSYSRRQYLRWVESMDLLTTLREHVHAFHHLGGVARVCLYDNFKAVVLRHDADASWPSKLTARCKRGNCWRSCRITSIEALAQGDIIRRKQNVAFVGQSGLGKSRHIQSIGLAACMLEHHVCYITSGELLADLTAALADQTIHDRVRFYAKFALLIIDEFGFDRTERAACPEAAGLWYKIIDAPLAMAMLDRVVDGATIVKLKGKSYRAHRGGEAPTHQ